MQQHPLLILVLQFQEWVRKGNEMDEHSIKELESQYQAALGRTKEAREEEAVARNRLQSAKFAATGFKDCVAEYTERGKTVRFLPKRMSRWGSYIEGPMIKKDGTPGNVDKQCELSKATNIGPYTPPAA